MKAELPMIRSAKIKRKKKTFCRTSSVNVLRAIARVGPIILFSKSRSHITTGNRLFHTVRDPAIEDMAGDAGR